MEAGQIDEGCPSPGGKRGEQGFEAILKSTQLLWKTLQVTYMTVPYPHPSREELRVVLYPSLGGETLLV